MKRALVISLMDLKRDPRVDRQIRFLQSDFEVVAAGLGPPAADLDVEYHHLTRAMPPAAAREEHGSPPSEPLALLDETERDLPLPQKLRVTATRIARGDMRLLLAFVRFVLAAMLEVAGARIPKRIPVRLPALPKRVRSEAFSLRRALAPYPRNYWMDPVFAHWARQLADVPADVIVVNDAMFLPAAVAIAHGRPLVLDAREYFPTQNNGNLHWRLTQSRMVRQICEREIPKVQGLLTVSSGLVDAYRDLTGVKAEVVTNAPLYYDLQPTEVHDPIRLIHWGGAAPQRRLEIMIDAMDYLDERFTLDMILVPGIPSYIDDLRRRAAPNSRIRFLEPVPMDDLPRFANAYDIGIYPLVPTHTNHRLALPNKFFEFVQARLAVAIGPSPEMVRIARRYDFGIVSDDFSPKVFARSLSVVSRERIRQLKINAHRAAPDLAGEHNAEIVRRVVRDAALNAGSDASSASP